MPFFTVIEVFLYCKNGECAGRDFKGIDLCRFGCFILSKSSINNRAKEVQRLYLLLFFSFTKMVDAPGDILNYNL
jgi:hypothetical protein